MGIFRYIIRTPVQDDIPLSELSSTKTIKLMIFLFFFFFFFLVNDETRSRSTVFHICTFVWWIAISLRYLANITPFSSLYHICCCFFFPWLGLACEAWSGEVKLLIYDRPGGYYLTYHISVLNTVAGNNTVIDCQSYHTYITQTNKRSNERYDLGRDRQENHQGGRGEHQRKHQLGHQLGIQKTFRKREVEKY